MKTKLLSIFITGSFLFSGNLWASAGGDDAGNGGNNFLKRSSVNQYTCLSFGGKVHSNGDIERTNYVRNFLYYMNEVMPDPIESNPFYVCHDEQMYGSEDSIEYPRLELIPNAFSLYSRFDARFQTGSGGKKEIDRMIEKRIMDELDVSMQMDLFPKFTVGANSFGFMVRPFFNTPSNRFFCPSEENLFVSPIIKIITEFTGQTQGLYVGQMEAQVITEGSVSKKVYSELQVSEQSLLEHGFYMRDGVKTRLEFEDQIETETIYFYYPFSRIQDPLVKGSRKLVTVRFPANSTYTKKLGCIFKK